MTLTGPRMVVRDFMTADVFTVEAGKKLLVAEKIMGWAKVRHVPVVDKKNHVVGMISNRDLLKSSISNLTTSLAAYEKKQHLTGIPIEDVMRTDVITIGPHEPVQRAAEIMRTKKIGCLPVVNDQNTLIGVLSEIDLLKIVEDIVEEIEP